MNRGLAYDSDDGRAYAGAITALMQAEAELQSARISRDQGGPFEGYAVNREPFLKVMNQHRDAAYRMNRELVPTDMLDAALTTWDEVIALGERHGFRNGQVSVLAPTGTIALPDGLRHDRRRAGHRAHQVQAAGRRRLPEDRQPGRHQRAAQARLRRQAGGGDRRLHRRARDDRGRAVPEGRAPAASSTAPSSRPTARAASTTTATSR